MRIPASICDPPDFLIDKSGLLLGLAMAAKWLAIPIGVDEEMDETGHVEPNSQSKGVSGVKGGEMYAN